MSMMKAVVLYGDRDLSTVELSKAEAGDDGVLINVKAVGVCGTVVVNHSRRVS